MKRTTISLPDDLALAVEREARRRRVSVSEVARQAIAEHVGLTTERRPLPFAALGRSGQRNVARDVEEILAREWTPDRDRCRGGDIPRGDKARAERGGGVPSRTRLNGRGGPGFRGLAQDRRSGGALRRFPARWHRRIARCSCRAAQLR